MKNLLTIALIGLTLGLATAQAQTPPAPAAVAVVAPVVVPAGVPVQVVAPAPAVVASPDAEAPGDFLTQVFNVIKSLGGLPWAGKIAAIIMLIISSTKVTFLKNVFWNKLGKAQSYVAPSLGALVGLCTLAAQGHLSAAGVFAYMTAGAGAIILYELLDGLKGLPGVGPMWVSLIGLIEGYLGANKAVVADAPVAPPVDNTPPPAA